MIPAKDIAGLLARFAELQRKAEARTGKRFGLVVIQEAGLDGLWLHGVLQAEDIDIDIDSHVVDPASIALSRHKSRAKTDKIDGEMLLRTLPLAYMRGEPQVCAMVKLPSPDEEDCHSCCNRFGDRKIVTAVGGAGPEPAAGERADAVPTHQPLNPAPARRPAFRANRGMHARTAVAAMMLAMEAADIDEQLAVCRRSRALRAASPCITAAGGGLENRHISVTSHLPA